MSLGHIGRSSVHVGAALSSADATSPICNATGDILIFDAFLCLINRIIPAASSAPKTSTPASTETTIMSFVFFFVYANFVVYSSSPFGH